MSILFVQCKDISYNYSRAAQVKTFGSLVKGLRVGVDLLTLLQNEGNTILSMSKVLNLPVLNGSDGLEKFLTQFEAAVESDFPNYQVCFFVTLLIIIVMTCLLSS